MADLLTPLLLRLLLRPPAPCLPLSMRVCCACVLWVVEVVRKNHCGVSRVGSKEQVKLGQGKRTANLVRRQGRKFFFLLHLSHHNPTPHPTQAHRPWPRPPLPGCSLGRKPSYRPWSHPPRRRARVHPPRPAPLLPPPAHALARSDDTCMCCLYCS